MKNYKIAVAGTGYVGLSLSVLLAQHNQVMAVDIVQAKVDMINNHKSPIQDDQIVKTPSGYWQQVPQVSIAQTYLKIMNKFAEQFGLTPSSRSRIIASDGGPADAADEMENLLGGGGS